MNPNGAPVVKKQLISFKKLVVPVGMRSIYWKYFGFPGNEEGEILTREKIICTLCKIQMAYNGNTSNLRMHLQNKHATHLANLEATSPPYVPKTRSKPKNPTKRQSEGNRIVHTVSFDGAMELGQTTSPQTHHGPIKFISIGSSGDSADNTNVEYITSDSLGDAVTYYLPEDGAPNRDPHEMGDALLRFFSSEMLNPSIIEGQGFQRLVSKLNPSIALPTAKQLEDEIIPQQYEDLKSGVMSEIDSLSEFSLSIEEWKGTQEDRRSFFTLSVHFQSDEQLISRLLPTLQLDTDDLDPLNKTLSHWGIEREKITAIVAATNDTYVKDVLEEWAPVVPCFMFTLQEAVRACFDLPEVSRVIKKCRSMLTLFKLRQCYETTEVAAYNIRMDYQNLWTTTYEMMQEFVNNKAEIVDLTTDMELKLSDEDWTLLTTIIDTCNSFKVTAHTLQEENPALLSIVRPLLWQLVTTYLQVKDGDSEMTQKLKNLLKEKLSSSYESQSLLLQTATTLDPRFKQLSYSTEDESEAIQKHVKELLAKVVQECMDPMATPTVTIITPSSSKKKVSGMELLLGELCSPVKQEFRPRDRASLELNQYTSENPVPFDENPLTWWQGAESKCPNLVKLAKKYTCVPACAIPTNRIPIKEREKFERQRASLSHELVDKMLFLNGNLI